MGNAEFISLARQTFKREAQAVARLADTIDLETFQSLVSMILACKSAGGRVIITGKGNSGAVARKVAYSLCCVDIPSFYLAPGEGYHASTGLIQPRDLLIAVSRGGESSEVMDLMKMAKHKNAKIITVTANPASPMAMASDLILRVSIDRDTEAHDYLATSSMLAMIAVFDAVALAIQPDRHHFDHSKE